MVEPGIFSLGWRVVLDAPLATLPRAETVIRGLRPQCYLILDQPVCKGREVHYEPGLVVLARLVKGDRLLAFHSKVLGHIGSPEALIFIQYPEAVEYGQIRKGKSFPVLFDAQVSTDPREVPLDQTGRCLIMGISCDGCMLQADSPLPFGTKLGISFALPEVGPVLDMAATVKSCQRGDTAWTLEVVFNPEKDQGFRQVQDYLRLLDQRQLDDAMLRLSSLD